MSLSSPSKIGLLSGIVLLGVCKDFQIAIIIFMEEFMKRASAFILTIIIACFGVAQGQTGADSNKAKQQTGTNQPATNKQSAAPAKQAAAPQPSTPGDKKEEDCGCEAKVPADAVATVNGVKFTIKDIDEQIKDRVQEVQSKVIEARKAELNIQINSKLLEAEAKKRGITTTKLLEQEVVAKVKEPTDAEAQAFYDQNKSQLEGEFKDLKLQILGHLRAERQRLEAMSLAQRLRAGAQVKVLVTEATPPQTAAERARLFATINGAQITSGDIEDALKPIIAAAQEHIYNLRKQVLEAKINDLLLDQEAQKRKLTPKAVYDMDIVPKVRKVTEEDARKFYEENKAKINGTFDQVKLQVIQYLQNQEVDKAETAYAQDLRKKATVQVFLNEPEPPVYSVATDDQPSKGNPNAPVTIVEFTDYQCPSCAATQPLLEELAGEYGDKVKLVSRDFPLSQHAEAAKAAEAAEAAREQGKYWEYVAILFKNQNALQVEKLKEYASQIGLDRAKFDQSLDSGKFADKVIRDLSEGNKLDVNSTPTVFINGKRVKDKSRESLKAAIEAALKDSPKR
jgi:protein-disulfide isomerase